MSVDRDRLAALPVASARRVAVRVTPDALRQVRGGHPWVYATSITNQSHEGAAGDLAVVFDSKRRFAAIGLLDPSSPIRVRVLHRGTPAPIDETFWRSLLTTALERRRGLADRGDTDGCRLVHGENDGFGGLVCDRYGSTLVVKIYTAAWLPHLRTLVPVLDETLAPDALVLRTSRNVTLPRQLDRGLAAASCDALAGTSSSPVLSAGLARSRALIGSLPSAPVPFREHGLAFGADVVSGQKTGHFLDQRDNRVTVGALAGGADVLDVFSCTGGFSVHAGAGGARSVTSVDASAPAIRAAARNMAANSHLPAVAACRHDTIVGDAFDVLAQLGREGRRFDVVVIDPPSFASTRSSVPAALHAYARLTALGIGVLRAGGTLVQSSCSSRIGAHEFFDTVHAAARGVGVVLEEVARTGHPVDHPIGFPQGAYLKTLFARVRDGRSLALPPSTPEVHTVDRRSPAARCRSEPVSLALPPSHRGVRYTPSATAAPR